ncbi:hypothetical protein D3C81_2014770 [compost metagenome]
MTRQGQGVFLNRHLLDRQGRTLLAARHLNLQFENGHQRHRGDSQRHQGLDQAEAVAPPRDSAHQTTPS